MRTFITALLVSSAIGCSSGTVYEPAICKTSTMTFDPSNLLATSLPSWHVPVSVPMIEGSTLVDMSGSIGKLGDYGDLNVQLTEDLLQNAGGDLSWVSQVLVLIESSSDPQKYPQTALADYTLTPTDQTTGLMNIPTLLDANTLLLYLTQGEVKLTFGLAGSFPQQPIDLVNEVCLDATLRVSKSL